MRTDILQQPRDCDLLLLCWLAYVGVNHREFTAASGKPCTILYNRAKIPNEFRQWFRRSRLAPEPDIWLAFTASPPGISALGSVVVWFGPLACKCWKQDDDWTWAAITLRSFTENSLKSDQRQIYALSINLWMCSSNSFRNFIASLFQVTVSFIIGPESQNKANQTSVQNCSNRSVRMYKESAWVLAKC